MTALFVLGNLPPPRRPVSRRKLADLAAALPLPFFFQSPPATNHRSRDCASATCPSSRIALAWSKWTAARILVKNPVSLHEPAFRSCVIRKCSALGSLNSRIKPLLEVRLEARKHLLFNTFYICEMVPTSDIAVFAGALKLHNEFLHQPQLVPVFFPEMLFADSAVCFCRFLVPNPILCPGSYLGTLYETNLRVEAGAERGIPKLPACERCEEEKARTTRAHRQHRVCES
jgi:hypothetical protein